MKKKKTEDGTVERDIKQERMELIQDVSPDRWCRLSHQAWKDSREAHSVMRTGQNKGQEAPWAGLTPRQKQKCILDYMAGVMTSEEFRISFAMAAVEDPIAVYKIFASTVPKEVDVSVSTQVGIVVLPGKAGSVAEWMDMANGVKSIDGEVIGSEGASTAETWKKILETK